ncbi:MAG: HAD hydrolase family protein [Eubacteriales bacterium]|nr:HAD hydrolase family protein [Clostridiales bacterium]MDY3286083.1 HAD hydrolase family protein [Eubacteriales bacterium]
MKTLYIADLDGTLLDPSPALTAYTRDTLNALSRRGLCFSAATARTPATVDVLLSGLVTGAPCVVMNGACVYDLPSRRYIKAETFPIGSILPVLRRFSLGGFAFSLQDGRLVTCYETVASDAARVYMEDRVRHFRKVFTQVTDLGAIRDAVYYSFTDRRERLVPAYEALKELPGLRVEFYVDVYHPENYYLEVASAAASKANAVQYVKKTCGFDRVVAFGDNYNDLPMFAVADESCAMANAREEVRAAATRIIGANTEDGVARYLESVFTDKEGASCRK